MGGRAAGEPRPFPEIKRRRIEGVEATMSSIDLETLIAPIEVEPPCGPSLDYDPAYLELERLAQGTPEQQMGDSVIAAQQVGPTGRLQFADIANGNPVPEAATRNIDLWTV